MAIVVLVLWLFTAGAGFYLLVTSNLGRARLAASPPATEPAQASVAAAQAPSAQAPSARAPSAQTAAAGPPATAPSPSKRDQRRAARDRFDPPSLTVAKSAPILPGPGALLEFAHPACAIIGLGFWLGFTFVHYRMLAWIGFGLVALTVCLGLTWFTANARAARHEAETEEKPSFSPRLAVLHGTAASVTVALAALTALVLTR
jgi:hypothetical protein